MNIFYTYAYLREDGTPYYIGKGKGNRAWDKGSRKTLPPTDSSRILILKKGLSEQDAFRHEIYMIFVFGRKDVGTGILLNFTDGGEGLTGGVHSEETREKIGNAHRGKFVTMETRRRISEASAFRPSVSDSTRKKLSEAGKGRELSEESRKKISEARKGKTFTEEHRRKLSEAKKGRSLSEATKLKMSQTTKGRKMSDEHRRRLSEAAKRRKK
jgi:hypothetical protein